MENFWTLALDKGGGNPIKSIMEKQAKYLAIITDNKLNAVIHTRFNHNNTDIIHYNFNIQVPMLDNYTYCLFTVETHLTCSDFSIDSPLTERELQVTPLDYRNNTELFTIQLQRILSSDKINSIINTLLNSI